MNTYSHSRKLTHDQRAKLKSNVKARIAVIVGGALLCSEFLIPTPVHAISYQPAIRALQRTTAQDQNSVQALESQATSLKQTVHDQEKAVAQLQQQIQQGESQRTALLAKIAAKKQEIASQKIVLGESIRQEYFAHQYTLLEQLAISKTMSNFVDKEEYDLITTQHIKITLDKINALKKQIEAKESALQKLLDDQRAMQSQIAAKQAATARLLSLNQSQIAAYNQRAIADNAKLVALQQKQAQLNAQGFIGPVKTQFPSTASATVAAADAVKSAPTVQSGTSIKYVNGRLYPYASAPWPNTIADPWGMYERQCVSYTAWKVAASGRHMPYWGGHGNAKQWPADARAAGIPVDSSPRVGDVAISTAGSYGHAMYVEKVYTDGTIYISQYNANWKGEYSEGHRTASGLLFIHF